MTSERSAAISDGDPFTFLTIITPTFRRPKGLVRCLASVAAQTVVANIDHLVMVDHVGRGIGKTLTRLQRFRDLKDLGKYVFILGDDDELPKDTVVEELWAYARTKTYPEVMVGWSYKGGVTLPLCPGQAPKIAQVDLGSYVVRRDVWRVFAKEFGNRYEGDFDFIKAMWDEQVDFVFTGIPLSRGRAGHGHAEGT